jgi:hypothetical protein
MNKDVKTGLTLTCNVKVYNEQRVVEQFKAEVPQTPEDLFDCSYSLLDQLAYEDHNSMCSISDEEDNEIWRISKTDLYAPEKGMGLYDNLLVNDLTQDHNFTYLVMTQTTFQRLA